jgi:hypothetical protein
MGEMHESLTALGRYKVSAELFDGANARVKL